MASPNQLVSETEEDGEEQKSTLFSKEYEKVDAKDLLIERLLRQVEEQAKRINLLELQYGDITQRMSVKIKKISNKVEQEEQQELEEL